MEFKSFNSIKRLETIVTITEKVHGSNAQVLIEDGEIKAGSRNRFLDVEEDNFGFAQWVDDNKEELIEKLGEGRHFGEWYGSGINSGYGLTKGEKRLALFDQRLVEQELPEGVVVVPVLYQGLFRDGIVTEIMDKLKEGGSVISPGFMRPEGVVVRFDANGAMFKKVFEAEETGWTKGTKVKSPKGEAIDVSEYLQPVRLEKLLSRDEQYLLNYPSSLPQLAKDYIADMEKEEQFKDVDEHTMKAIKRKVFPFIKELIIHGQ